MVNVCVSACVSVCVCGSSSVTGYRLIIKNNFKHRLVIRKVLSFIHKYTNTSYKVSKNLIQIFVGISDQLSHIKELNECNKS